MIKNIEFTKGNWEEEFVYACTDRFPFAPEFIQEEDCIANGRNPEMKDGYDYTTIMTKEKYGSGTKLWFTCSFEAYGAPLITLTDKVWENENGDLRYSDCHEVVVWEDGINVWHLFEEDGTIKWNKLLALSIPLKAGEKHELFTEITDKYIRIGIKGHEALLRIDNLPKEVYLGVTGCENINRLYSLKIESEN